jgi:hypothetical protein
MTQRTLSQHESRSEETRDGRRATRACARRAWRRGLFVFCGSRAARSGETCAHTRTARTSVFAEVVALGGVLPLRTLHNTHTSVNRICIYIYVHVSRSQVNSQGSFRLYHIYRALSVRFEPTATAATTRRHNASCTHASQSHASHASALERHTRDAEISSGIISLGIIYDMMRGEKEPR